MELAFCPPLYHALAACSKTLIICLTVVVCFAIAKSLVIKALKNKSTTDEHDGNKDQPQENEAVLTNLAEQRLKARYEAAWKFVNMCWMVQHPQPFKDDKGNYVAPEPREPLTKEDEERYREAWACVREYLNYKNTTSK